MDFRVTNGWFGVFIAGLFLVISSPSLAATFDLGTLQEGNTLERDGDFVVNQSNPQVVIPNTYTFTNTINRKGLLYASISGSFGAITTTAFSGQGEGTVVPDPDNNRTLILMPVDYFKPYAENEPDAAGEYSFTVSPDVTTFGAFTYDVEVGWLDPQIESLGELQADANINIDAVGYADLRPLGVYWLQFHISEFADAQSLRFRTTPPAGSSERVDIYLYNEDTGLVAPQPITNTHELELGADDLSPGAYTLIVTGTGSSFSNQQPGLKRSTNTIFIAGYSSDAVTADLGTLDEAGILADLGPILIRSRDNPHTYTFKNTNSQRGMLYATVKALNTSSDNIAVSEFSMGGENKGIVKFDGDGNSRHILLPNDYFQPGPGFGSNTEGDYTFSVRLDTSTSGEYSYNLEVGWLDTEELFLGALDAPATGVDVSLAELGVYNIEFIIPAADYADLVIEKTSEIPLSGAAAITNVFLLDSNNNIIEQDIGTDGSNLLEFGVGSSPMLEPGSYNLVVAGRESDLDEQTPGYRASESLIRFYYSSTNSCEQYESTRRIASMKWHLLSVPCNAPSGTTMADLTSFEEQEGINPPWDAYVYIPGVGYDPLTMDSPIPDAGTGFWLISSIDDMELQMPAGSTPVQNMAGTDPCESGRRCAMATVSHNNWNLTGNPLNYNLDYAGLRLTNVDSQCLPGTPCLPGNPEHQAEASLFFYNELLGAYVPFSEQNTQVAIPWDGFWARISAPNAVDPIETPWQLYSHEYPSQFMFVTDGVFDTDLRDEVVPPADSGYEAAHTICQAEADAAALPGDYRAWVDDPATQFSQLDTPYVTAQGRQIAASFGDLTDGEIDVPVNVIAVGMTAAGSSDVLTGVGPDGTPADIDGLGIFDCNSWHFSGEDIFGDTRGLAGTMMYTGMEWTFNRGINCSPNFKGRLYCVSQGRLLTLR